MEHCIIIIIYSFICCSIVFSDMWIKTYASMAILTGYITLNSSFSCPQKGMLDEFNYSNDASIYGSVVAPYCLKPVKICVGVALFERNLSNV